jgi:thymidylate synthase (FAD)
MLVVAKEQARKDLPLSTYTEAYWKINLHNLFHFLRLRMDSHAQLEIRQYANAIAEIVKQVVPVAWEAFEDYRLNAKNFSAMEIERIKDMLNKYEGAAQYTSQYSLFTDKPDSMTDREWKEFKEKLQ